MSASKRGSLLVKDAISRLKATVDDVEAVGRSDAELKAVLVETILIVEAWETRGQETVDKKVEVLRKKVEHKQGRLGNTYSLLLRAAFGEVGVKSWKTGGWGKACENMALWLNQNEIKIQRRTLEAEFMKIGVERARRNEFP